MREWHNEALECIAEIRPSNVDKKTNPSEEPVRLCNYMDVYAHGYITKDFEFMDATATPAEILRFGIERGDIMITKDSETPDDIGIPAVVMDGIPNLVCGYHLALVKPNRTKVDPIYLAKQLALSDTSRYFGRLANGSTRFGLTLQSIARTPIRLAPIAQQKRIAEILSTVDEAIEQTEAMIAKTQQIKAGLMHDLFTRGVTADGKLRPPREEAPHLYKESPLGWIPKEWEAPLLDNVATRGSGHTPNQSHPEYWNGGVKWLSLADSWRLDRTYVSETEKEISDSGLANSSAVLLPAGTVIVSRDGSRLGKSGILGVDMAISQHFIAWTCGPSLDNVFLFWTLQYRKRELENVATGSTIPTIGLQFFKRLRVGLPRDIQEQEAVGQILLSTHADFICHDLNREKLVLLKSGLMHDLLTGRVPVTVAGAANAGEGAADV